MTTRYDEFPNHPLAGVPQEVLDCAREVVRTVAVEDVHLATLADSLADAVVAELRIKGFIKVD